MQADFTPHDESLDCFILGNSLGGGYASTHIKTSLR